MADTNRVLLVFDSFGEDDLAFYLIDDPPDWLGGCHNKYLGEDGLDDALEDAIIIVLDAICEDPDMRSDNAGELAGAWVSKRIDLKSQPVDLGTVTIVVTGYIP